LSLAEQRALKGNRSNQALRRVRMSGRFRSAAWAQGFIEPLAEQEAGQLACRN